MKQLKKALGACAAMFGLAAALVMMPVKVQAAELTTTTEEAVTTEAVVPTTEITMEEALRSIFSAEYYAAKNPDVVALLGDDEEVLYQHYLEFGIPEGRDVSPVIDLKAYRNGNPDLIERYGNDWAGILSQFVTEGIYEMAEGTRPATGVRFNPVTYLLMNPDAEALTGGSLLKVVELFIAEGMPSGIWADESITGGEEVSVTLTDTVVSVMANDNLMMSTPVVFEPTVEYVPVVSDTANNDTSGQTSGNETGNPVKQPDPVRPNPVNPAPVCDHSKVFCGNTCNICNQVIGHYFGESGTAPYCEKCNADYVQIMGCPHDNWAGGTCTLCWKVDGYYTFHETMHPDETCPDCGYTGTLLYDIDKCPGHSYTDGVCMNCGDAETVVPPEDETLDEDEDLEGAEVAMLMLEADVEAIVADVAGDEETIADEDEAIADEKVVLDEEATDEDVADVEDEAVEAADADTETEESEADIESADEEDAAVAEESVEVVDAENVEVSGAEVISFTGATDGAVAAEGVELNAAAEAA